jgi:hypothetical protein
MSPQRLALAGILAAIAALGFLPGSAGAVAPSTFVPHHPITIAAYRHLGQQGGQCWTFARDVVKEATGLEMGFDYREGYFQAGAVEVSAAEAREGDIIQIADDSYSKPDADYPGLHTFIITENLGGGSFNGIDSNSQWDEVVRERFDYTPGEIAAERSTADHPLSFHIYRFPVPGVTLPPTTSVKTANFEPGDKARVNTSGDTLNLRDKPAGTVVGKLADRTIVTIISAQKVTVNGRDWVQVSTPIGEGWVASQYLQAASAEASGTITGPLLPYKKTVALLISGG